MGHALTAIGRPLGPACRASAAQHRATAAGCDPSRAVLDRPSLTVGLVSRAGSRASTGVPDPRSRAWRSHAPVVESKGPVVDSGLGRLQAAAFATAAASEASMAVVHAASAAVAVARAASPAVASQLWRRWRSRGFSGGGGGGRRRERLWRWRRGFGGGGGGGGGGRR